MRLAAKVTGVDFTDPKNDKKRIKFENKLLRLAKAMSGTFKYTSHVEHQRRHLIGGAIVNVDVNVTLAFSSNADAEATATVVTSNQFATDLSKELQTEKDFGAVTVSDTQGTLKTYEVVELVEDTKVSDTSDTVTQAGGGGDGRGGNTTAKTKTVSDAITGQKVIHKTIKKNTQKVVDKPKGPTTTILSVLSTASRSVNSMSIMTSIICGAIVFINLG